LSIFKSHSLILKSRNSTKGREKNRMDAGSQQHVALLAAADGITDEHADEQSRRP
jgi:hypothetical protein